MTKILSQAGVTLADVYDVVGSVAGIEQLESREVGLVHEMGSTIFSERMRTTIRREATGDLAQGTEVNIVTSNMPVTINRLLGIAVITDDASRLGRITILARDPANGLEIPVWIWDGANSDRINMRDAGSAVTAFDLLRGLPSNQFIPNLTGGGDQGPDPVNELALRGVTAAFGAGTVFVRAFYYIAFPFLGGVSSKGLPIPSW